VLAPNKSEQRLNGIAISRGGCDVPAAGYAREGRARKIFAKALTRSPGDELALQLPFMQFSESMGNHDSKIVDAASVD